MDLRIVQWNIGGCLIESKGILEESTDYIAEILLKFKPDIITLQEVLKNDSGEQIADLSKKLNISNYSADYYSTSHLVNNSETGHGIISKFPIGNTSFELFENPNYSFSHKSGAVWKTHDKGISKYTIKTESSELVVANTHLLPLKKFGHNWNLQNWKVS